MERQSQQRLQIENTHTHTVPGEKTTTVSILHFQFKGQLCSFHSFVLKKKKEKSKEDKTTTLLKWYKSASQHIHLIKVILILIYVGKDERIIKAIKIYHICIYDK